MYDKQDTERPDLEVLRQLLASATHDASTRTRVPGVAAHQIAPSTYDSGIDSI